MEKAEPVVFYGDGIDAYEEKIREAMIEGDIDYTFAEDMMRNQSSELIAKAALRMYKNGEVITYNELKPDYMRKAEAQQKLEEGKLWLRLGLLI